MRKIVVLFVVLAALAAGAGSVSAHFQTFWPDSPNGYGKLGQQVSWQYFWGHPYEMVIFDAQRPGVYAVTPQGEKEKVSVEPAEMQDPATGLARKTFTFTYTPESLGDTWLVVEAPDGPLKVEDVLATVNGRPFAHAGELTAPPAGPLALVCHLA